ncbi:invasion associated locus B family protein [Pelagibacterium limicola]|uniref:invasion associated locus B family protein n=1 Tax=Pelagibacterium limicola TaxID=2791022 RepID=UPI0018AFFBF5|nr:invasion associated locus B family protein [Pelagibacterium limicola]
MKSLAALAFVLGLATPAFGQSVRILGDHNAWSAYATTENAGRICFALSKPTSVEPQPDGYTDAYFYLTHRPSEGVRTEINIVSGYNFAPDVPATLTIGGQSFALFTRGDAAWLADPGQSSAAAQAIRAGSTMTIEGTSERGIKIRQVFSLSGATAASRSIDSGCP